MADTVEMEELGRLAAACELRAERKDLDPWEVVCLRERAQQFRNRQTAEMVRLMAESDPAPTEEGEPEPIGLGAQFLIFSASLAIGAVLGLGVIPWIAEHFIH